MSQRIKKTQKKLTFTIAIPVYRDTENIQLLVKRLLAQWLTHAELRKIIILSDPSKIVTNRIARNLFDPRVILTTDNYQLRPQNVINRLRTYLTDDILILIDNETLPRTHFVLDDLIYPFTLPQAQTIGMVLGQPVLPQPETFSEHFHYHYNRLVSSLYLTWKAGLNVYSANCRYWKALPKSLIDQLSCPNHLPADDYLYFQVKTLGKKILQSSAGILLPDPRVYKNLAPRHLEFPAYKKDMQEMFPKINSEDEYSIPEELIRTQIRDSFTKYPFWTSMIVLDNILRRLPDRKLLKSILTVPA